MEGWSEAENALISNIWPRVKMDMQVPNQKEGSSPEQESPQQKEDTETGRSTVRFSHLYCLSFSSMLL